MLKNMPLRNRLFLSFALMLILLVIVLLVGLYRLSVSNRSLSEIVDKHYAIIDTVNSVQKITLDNGRQIRTLLLVASDNRALYLEKIARNRGENTLLLNRLEHMLDTQQAKEMFEDVMLKRGSLNRIYEQVFAQLEKNQLEEATQTVLTLFFSNNDIYLEALGKLEKWQKERLTSAREESRASYNETVLLLYSVAGINFLIAITLAFSLARSITKPLSIVMSSFDALHNDNQMRQNIVERIASGDYEQTFHPSQGTAINSSQFTKDELGQLLQAVAEIENLQSHLDQSILSMLVALRNAHQEAQERDWHKTAVNELAICLQGDRSVNELSNKVLAFLIPYVDAAMGVFYLYDAQGKELYLEASYAFTQRKDINNRIALGEGLAGEAARELKTICLSSVPAEFFPIASALGQTAAGSVLAIPLVHDNQLIALMEIGRFGMFTEAQRSLLQHAAESLALGISVNLARQHVDALLAQTQEQTEELRMQQEEMQQQNEELEERTQALKHQGEMIRNQNSELEAASQVLREKSEQLEKTSTYKSEFLANMSHELRTPLNSMMILSRIMSENKEGNLTERQCEYAKTIHSAGKDLLTLINDILDLSKVEAGQIEFVYEDIRVSSVIEDLRGLFQPLTEQKNLQLLFTVAPNIAETLHIDRQRVMQVLKNLLSNAIKFTAQGTVALEIAITNKSNNPLLVPSVNFSVQDTGIGIPENKRALVFEAFKQADGSTSRQYGGTGLGLSIARQLACQMGGDLQLASNTKWSSIFTLTLPLQVAVSNSNPVLEAPASFPIPSNNPATCTKLPPQKSVTLLADDREQLKQGERTILIIEDDPCFAAILQERVNAKGHSSLIASNGESGLELADQYVPNAIILDVMLPDLDGWGVMLKLKNNPHTQHIPVHFITCLADSQRALSMGAVGLLTKPVMQQQLDDMLFTLEKHICKNIRRLLIVEDNSHEAVSLGALFHSRDIELYFAKTAEEAIQQLAVETFDCIILDLGLAGISGFTVLEHLQQLDSAYRIPVVIHTGRELSKEEDTFLHRFADSIVIKGVASHNRLLDEVTLFLHSVESKLPTSQQQLLRDSVTKESQFEGKTVLIVDDDIRNIFSLSSLLSEKALTILEAENGREALAKLEQYPKIDIVLMDIMMPEMDGYEAIQAIRKHPQFAKLPVIAMTAKALKTDREKCLAAGASDYISKPVDIDKLFSLLRVWLYHSDTRVP